MDRTDRLIKVAQPCVDEEEVAAVREVLLSGQYVSGARVKAFEEAFATYIGVEHCVATSSGTAALHIGLSASGIGPGDEVIVPALTFFATVSAVLAQRATPVFADLQPETYCLDPKDVERRITPRTKAILAVHLFGNAADIEGLGRVAQAHGLQLFEDCAQAHGTEYAGKKVGSFGAFGAFSFFATKHMTTGEGGMIATNDESLAYRARLIRNHGMINRDEHVVLGANYRMTEMAAAMGLVQLRKLEELNQRRIENSLYLLKRLEGTKGLILPTLEPRIKHTFFWCPILLEEEVLGLKTADFIQQLRERGVETRHRYHAPLYRQPVLRDPEVLKQLGRDDLSSEVQPPDYDSIWLPVAERIAGKIIGLPNHPQLTRKELDYVVEVVKTLALEGSLP